MSQSQPSNRSGLHNLYETLLQLSPNLQFHDDFQAGILANPKVLQAVVGVVSELTELRRVNEEADNKSNTNRQGGGSRKGKEPLGYGDGCRDAGAGKGSNREKDAKITHLLTSLTTLSSLTSSISSRLLQTCDSLSSTVRQLETTKEEKEALMVVNEVLRKRVMDEREKNMDMGGAVDAFHRNEKGKGKVINEMIYVVNKPISVTTSRPSSSRSPSPSCCSISSCSSSSSSSSSFSTSSPRSRIPSSSSSTSTSSESTFVQVPRTKAKSNDKEKGREKERRGKEGIDPKRVKKSESKRDGISRCQAQERHYHHHHHQGLPSALTTKHFPPRSRDPSAEPIGGPSLGRGDSQKRSKPTPMTTNEENNNKMEPKQSRGKTKTRPMGMKKTVSRTRLMKDLTREIDLLRREGEKEKREMEEELSHLTTRLQTRESELFALFEQLDQLLGLKGFAYMRLTQQRYESMKDRDGGVNDEGEVNYRELTPRPERRNNTDVDLKGKGKGTTALVSDGKTLGSRSGVRAGSGEATRLEKEVEQLEMLISQASASKQEPNDDPAQLRNGGTATQGNRPLGHRAGITVTNSSIGVDGNGQGDEGDDWPLEQPERHQLKTALKDLGFQVEKLKGDLRELKRERDNLRQLYEYERRSSTANSRLQQAASSQEDGVSSLGGEMMGEASQELEELRVRFENEKQQLLNLLGNSESHVQELEKRLEVQEVEFETIAQRVKERLQEQKGKLDLANEDISSLLHSLRQAEDQASLNASYLSQERDLLMKERERSRLLEELLLRRVPDSDDGLTKEVDSLEDDKEEESGLRSFVGMGGNYVKSPEEIEEVVQLGSGRKEDWEFQLGLPELPPSRTGSEQQSRRSRDEMRRDNVGSRMGSRHGSRQGSGSGLGLGSGMERGSGNQGHHQRFVSDQAEKTKRGGGSR